MAWHLSCNPHDTHKETECSNTVAMQVSSLQEEVQSGSTSRQELERQVQAGKERQRKLEGQVEEGERRGREMQGAAQQGKAAEVQVKALQARLAQATQAAATMGQDLAEARTQAWSLPPLQTTLRSGEGVGLVDQVYCSSASF